MKMIIKKYSGRFYQFYLVDKKLVSREEVSLLKLTSEFWLELFTISFARNGLKHIDSNDSSGAILQA